MKFLGDYTWEFEMIGEIIIREHRQTTAKRFENIEPYEWDTNNFGLN